MSLQMIDPNEGAIQTEGQRLPVHHSHEQRAHQAGTRGNRYSIELLQLDAGLGQRLFGHRFDGLHVGTAGQLRYHSPEDAMNVLGQDHQ
jgi:hypothetical protein